MSDKKNIILIDDNQDDYQAFLRAFSAISADNNYSIIWLDGGYDETSCIKKLNTILQNIVEIPKLIMLDINMPGINGKEFIDIIRKINILQSIPIVILSNSDDPDEILQCYKKGASGFIKKPMEFDKLKHICNILHIYWFDVVLLPPSDVN